MDTAPQSIARRFRSQDTSTNASVVDGRGNNGTGRLRELQPQGVVGRQQWLLHAVPAQRARAGVRACATGGGGQPFDGGRRLLHSVLADFRRRRRAGCGLELLCRAGSHVVVPPGLWTWRDRRSYRHQWLPQPQRRKSGRRRAEDYQAGLKTKP